jgi:uncharacterized membrane protein
LTQGIAPLAWRRWMQGLRRRIVHTLVFELIAITIVTLAFMGLVQADAQRSGLLAAACSLVAMAWNMGYNWWFERWEARQADRGRSVWRRAAHAIGFEAGLVLLLVPVIAWWLNIGLWQALVLDIGLSVFFLFYAFAFNWGFDHLFGLPGRPVQDQGEAAAQSVSPSN